MLKSKFTKLLNEINKLLDAVIWGSVALTVVLFSLKFVRETIEQSIEEGRYTNAILVFTAWFIAVILAYMGKLITISIDKKEEKDNSQIAQ